MTNKARDWKTNPAENTGIAPQDSTLIGSLDDKIREVQAAIAILIGDMGIKNATPVGSSVNRFNVSLNSTESTEPTTGLMVAVSFLAKPIPDEDDGVQLSLNNGTFHEVRIGVNNALQANEIEIGRTYLLAWRASVSQWWVVGAKEQTEVPNVPEVLQTEQFPELVDKQFFQVELVDDPDGNEPGDANYEDTYRIEMTALAEQLLTFPDAPVAGGFVFQPSRENADAAVPPLVHKKLDNAFVDAPEVADAEVGSILEVSPRNDQGQPVGNPLQYVGKAALLTALKGLVGFPQVLDVRVFTASGNWQAPANARRFFAILTGGGGGGGGGGGVTGQAGGTAFGWWTENQQTTFTITVGAGGGVNQNVDGEDSRVQVGGAVRLLAHKGGRSTARNNANINGTGAAFGSGALFHIHGGLGADVNAGQVESGGSSFWGGMGAFGAGGGEYYNNNQASVGGGGGLAIIVAFG